MDKQICIYCYWLNKSHPSYFITKCLNQIIIICWTRILSLCNPFMWSSCLNFKFYVKNTNEKNIFHFRFALNKNHERFRETSSRTLDPKAKIRVSINKWFWRAINRPHSSGWYHDSGSHPPPSREILNYFFTIRIFCYALIYNNLARIYNPVPLKGEITDTRNI